MNRRALKFLVAMLCVGCGQSVEVGRDVPTVPDLGELCDPGGGPYGWPDGAPAWTPRCHLPQRCMPLPITGYECR